MDYLFWLSTLIPGWAAGRIFLPSQMRRGILAALASAFVLTVALMTPLVAAAYAFHMKAATVWWLYAVVCMAGVTMAAVRGVGRLSPRRVLCHPEWPALIVVVFVVIFTARTLGGGTRFDNQMHAAKILYMLETGFSLKDPYSPADITFSPFPANTLHVLHVIGSWLTGIPPLEFWSGSLWFFRILAFGGLEFLAAVVFRSRLAAVATILGALFVFGFGAETTLPNGMSAFVIFPVLLGHVIQVLEKTGRTGYWKVGLSALALGGIHFGFWLIAVLCVAPVVVGFTLWQYWCGRSATGGLTCAGLLSAGVPFLIPAAVQPNHALEQMGGLWAHSIHTINLWQGWKLHMLRPPEFMWMAPVGLLCLLLVLVSRQGRTRQAVLMGVFAATLCYMFNPLVFEAFSRVLPYWMIQRAAYIAKVVGFVVIPGGLAWMLRASVRGRVVRVVFALAVISAGRIVFAPQMKQAYLMRAKDQAALQEARELREMLGSLSETRPLVAADAQTSLLIPAVHVAAVMAPQPGNTNPADTQLLERDQACRRLLDPSTPIDVRQRIAHRYRIDYLLIRKDDSGQPGEFPRVAELVAERERFSLFRVRL